MLPAFEISVIAKYLAELRTKLLQCFTLWLSVFVVFYCFADKLYHMLALPLLHKLPLGSQLISTSIVAPFFIPLKFAAYSALFCTFPFMLYLFWLFIAPALYGYEKRWLWSLLVGGISLFYLGVCFAFFVVFPLIFEFFAAITPRDVYLMPDISCYLDFSLRMFWAFGLAFQVPIITIMAVKMQWISVASLRAKRPYVIVLAFIMGMLLTPPDVLSQVLLALPMWGLFEIALVICQRFKKV